MNYIKLRLLITRRVPLILLASVALVSCDPGQPSSSSGVEITGFAAPLSQSEFNSLDAEEQYQVASKLYGTFYRGIPADDFYNLDSGISSLSPKSTTFLTDVRKSLETQLSSTELIAVNAVIEGFDEEGNPSEADAKYEFDTESRPDRNQRAMQIPLARIKEYPISRDFYVQWMAYFLANTIMYSPAVEMETTDTLDAQNMYSFLSSRIKDKQSVREMVRGNLPSLARWRVSRS
ncbi:MAG: hypothetical protein KAI17_22760, partial [Thiotrichaceae bacterium]|nr:hypothetical protein [Thiotrichaceae bacterium]